MTNFEDSQDISQLRFTSEPKHSDTSSSVVQGTGGSSEFFGDATEEVVLGHVSFENDVFLFG
jgi:hypothetical protein